MRVFLKYNTDEELQVGIDTELLPNNWVTEVGFESRYSSGNLKSPRLYFYAVKPSIISFPYGYNVEYSNDGLHWHPLTDILLKAGSKVYVRGFESTYDGNSFNINGVVKIGGDLKALHIDQDEFNLEGLFKGQTAIKYLNLTISDETVPEGAYKQLFMNCTNLKTAPKMNSKVYLDNSCEEMFKGCTSIKEVVLNNLESFTTTSFLNWLDGASPYGVVKHSSPRATLSELCPENWEDENTRMFCITALKDSVLYFNNSQYSTSSTYARYFYYRLNTDKYWKSYSNLNYLSEEGAASYGSSMTITIPKGKKLYIYGNNTLLSFRGYYTNSNSYKVNLRFTGDVKLSGDITTLINMGIKDTDILESGQFAYLFYTGNNSPYYTTPIDASELILPSKTLNTYLYYYMFCYCQGLTTPPQMLATVLNTSCCYDMFYYCTKLTKAPELFAVDVPSSAYYYMFYYCTSLSEIKTHLLTQMNVNSNTYYWVSGVSSSGTFYKPKNATYTSTGSSYIPSGWTVKTF